MLHQVGAKLRRLGVLFALLLAVFAVAPMAQAVCICDVEMSVAADSDTSLSATDQSAGDENCVCAACHCVHVSSETASPFKAISLAAFAIDRAAALNDVRLLPLPPNALERPPRG